MAIVTRHRTDKFAIIPNSVAEDARLTFEARGVLCYLLAKPNNWQVSVDDIRKAGGIGRDKVYRILKELLDAGYLRRVIHRDQTGKVTETEYTVFDEPIRDEKPLPEKPDTAEPEAGEPDTDNQDGLIRTHPEQEPKVTRTQGARVRARPSKSSKSKSRNGSTGNPLVAALKEFAE
jgi:hypothetical protein